MIDDDIDWIPGYPPRLAHRRPPSAFPEAPQKEAGTGPQVSHTRSFRSFRTVEGEELTTSTILPVTKQQVSPPEANRRLTLSSNRPPPPHTGAPHPILFSTRWHHGVSPVL